jgi:hypothetical protein
MQKAPWEDGVKVFDNPISYEVFTPAVLSDLDLRVKAVEAATRMYSEKAIGNLKDYNEKFEQLINLIYKFYKDGINKELH